MPRGELTARVALSLQQEYESQEFRVLYDHRIKDTGSTDQPGKIRIWFGSSLKFETLLADLDIAIISQENRVVALIEIEETTDKPKVILGDILSILLGSGISFKGNQEFLVDEWTTLLVMSKDGHQSPKARNEFLSNQINSLKSVLDTTNAKIGRIILDSFADEKQLEEKLKQHVMKAIACYESEISTASKN